MGNIKFRRGIKHVGRHSPSGNSAKTERGYKPGSPFSHNHIHLYPSPAELASNIHCLISSDAPCYSQNYRLPFKHDAPKKFTKFTSQLLNDFITSRATGTSQKTITLYHVALDRFIGYPLTPEGIKGYLNSLSYGNGEVRQWFSEYDSFEISTHGIATMLQKLGKETGIHCNPHSFRRGFCIHQVKSGLSTRVVQALGGWEQLTMVEHYSKSLTFDDALTVYKSANLVEPRDGVEIH